MSKLTTITDRALELASQAGTPAHSTSKTMHAACARVATAPTLA